MHIVVLQLNLKLKKKEVDDCFRPLGYTVHPMLTSLSIDVRLLCPRRRRRQTRVSSVADVYK